MILKGRAGNTVKRYHTINLLVEETVGHHSANVALLCAALTVGPVSANLLLAALRHDTAEQFTGDIPATAKWAHPLLKNIVGQIEALHVTLPSLSQGEQRILKQADMLDLCFKCLEELSMGNASVTPMLHRGVDYLWSNDPIETTVAMLKEHFYDYNPE